jgi:hypothetical protein
MESLLAIGVLGFYDPETGELVVRGRDPTLYTQQTNVNEMVHALDDQWFELDRPEVDEADDESSFGLAAIAEGNARRIEDQWEADLSDADRTALLQEEMAFGMQVDPSIVAAIPLVLIDLIQAPYDLGEVLVAELLANGGQDRLDAAFAEPPTTSEQVMHPERYLAGEPVIQVDPPEAGGEVIDEGAFGELMIELLLTSELGARDARTVADGWGGDWYVAWTEGGETCLRADFVADTATDLTEMEQGFQAWAESTTVDASVEAVTVDGEDGLRVTSCG